MNKETIEIKKDSVIEVYNTARNTSDYGTLHALESLFGIDFFKPKDVRERIKTFDDAIDWEQRRYEIAKDIMAAFLSNSCVDVHGDSAEEHASDAVLYADELISELKKGSQDEPKMD